MGRLTDYYNDLHDSQRGQLSEFFDQLATAGAAQVDPWPAKAAAGSARYPANDPRSKEFWRWTRQDPYVRRLQKRIDDLDLDAA